jgi:hypothetical protein
MLLLLTRDGRILPNKATFVREGEKLGGAQRLAILLFDFSRWSQRSSAHVSPGPALRVPRRTLASSFSPRLAERRWSAAHRAGAPAAGQFSRQQETPS